MASVIRRSSSRTVAFSPASSIAATAELHHVLRALSDADYAAVNGNASDGWTRSATQALVDAVMAGRDCGDVDGLPFSAAECRARFERVSAALVTAKRRLDFDGEKSGASANPSAAWPPARQKAWAALATDPNAYYMKWGKPGVAVDEGEWRPDELGLFDKLMKERPPLGQWGNSCNVQRAYQLDSESHSNRPVLVVFPYADGCPVQEAVRNQATYRPVSNAADSQGRRREEEQVQETLCWVKVATCG